MHSWRVPNDRRPERRGITRTVSPKEGAERRGMSGLGNVGEKWDPDKESHRFEVCGHGWMPPMSGTGTVARSCSVTDKEGRCRRSVARAEKWGKGEGKVQTRVRRVCVGWCA